MKKDIEVIEASSISDRIAYIKIRKCSKWGMRSEEMRKVFYRLEKKKSEMVIINCYAPHMGLVQKNPEIAKKFYKELREVKEKFRGQDVLIVGDFNAKLGSKESDGGPVGSHARGIRNENGDSLYLFLADHQMIAANTFFKHKASHITTWEGAHNNKKIYNQIDYILIPANRKKSMINARSHIVHEVDTDHRLVTAVLFRKNDYERKKQPPKTRKECSDKILGELKLKKRNLRERQTQSRKPLDESAKKARNRLNNAIKKRKAFLIINDLITEAKELMNAKDNALVARAIKRP